MKKHSTSTLEFLANVLEDFGTAQVLTTPSDDDRDEATAALDGMPQDPLVKDLAVLAANKVADELHAMALRPADYADMKDLPEKVLSKLTKMLSGKGREYFVDEFRKQLGARG